MTCGVVWWGRCVLVTGCGRVLVTMIVGGLSERRVLRVLRGLRIPLMVLLGGDPLVGWVEDSNGRVTTRVDLLGRVGRYQDVWGTVTTTGDNDLGQPVTSTTTPPSVGGVAQAGSTTALSFTVNGDIDTVTVADAAYDSAGQLAGVRYANDTELARMARSAVTNMLTARSWTFPNAQKAVT